MALEDHPNVFRFEGRLWVSEDPRETASRDFAAQRKWDAGQLRSQHWTLALALGALAGTAATLGLGTAAGLAPVFYLVLLPLGFGAGAVVGAVVNKRILGPRLTEVPTTPRPETPHLTRIPAAVARHTDENTPLADLVAWSEQGFVPKDERRPTR